MQGTRNAISMFTEVLTSEISQRPLAYASFPAHRPIIDLMNDY